MTEVKFLGDDKEFLFSEKPLEQRKRQGCHVEIVTQGVWHLLFINGQRIDRVLDIDLAQRSGQVGPQIRLALNPAEIKVRSVDGEEFRRLAGTAASE